MVILAPLQCQVLCWALQRETDRDRVETKGHQGSGALPIGREAERAGAVQQKEGDPEGFYQCLWGGRKVESGSSLSPEGWGLQESSRVPRKV